MGALVDVDMSFVFALAVLLLVGAFALTSRRSAKEKVMIVLAVVIFAVVMPFTTQL